jgi:hypothetical protein
LCWNSDVLCTPSTCDPTLAHFTYIPNLAANAFLVALFGVCTLVQFGLGIRYRAWGVLIAAICGLTLEVIGYSGRITINQNPFNIYLIYLTIDRLFFLLASIFASLASLWSMVRISVALDLGSIPLASVLATLFLFFCRLWGCDCIYRQRLQNRKYFLGFLNLLAKLI